MNAAETERYWKVSDTARTAEEQFRTCTWKLSARHSLLLINSGPEAAAFYLFSL